MRDRLLTAARWADRNAPELLGVAGLLGVFVGLLCSPWPWTAPVVVGAMLFGGFVWTHLRGGYRNDAA